MGQDQADARPRTLHEIFARETAGDVYGRGGGSEPGENVIATCYDKDPANFMAAVKLICARIWCAT